MTKGHRTIASLLTVIAVLVVPACDAGYSSSSTDSSSRRASKPRQEWYSGGTLHKATIREWKAASYRNRLATCADFVSGTMLNRGMKAKDIDISEGGRVWRSATDLETCISGGTAGLEVTDTMSVAELAAACMVLMKI